MKTNMDNPLSTAIAILSDLEAELESVEKIWGQLRQDNPSFEEMSENSWQSKRACIWLHGATQVQERNELEKWLNFNTVPSPMANDKATIYYKNWGYHIMAEGIYADFFDDDLVPPIQNENLFEYIWGLADRVQNNGWGSKKSKRALRSFLSYLRNDTPIEEIAFLEHIFPQKMDLRHRSIIRLIRPQVFPISIERAAEIIRTLAKAVIDGRPNARIKNAEALALCWLCLTSSRIRLPKTLEGVHAMCIDALAYENETPFIMIPTIFGPQKLQISKTVAKYLNVIADIYSDHDRKVIIHSTLHDLRRTLKSAIKKAGISEDYGEITFLTFMSSPHHGGDDVRPRKPQSKKSKLSPSVPV